MSANETQIAGTHYKASIQHWDYVLQFLDGRYLEGNISKYVTRHRKKNGMQDLLKARHYMTKLVEEFKAGRYSPKDNPMLSSQVYEFAVANGLNTQEMLIVQRLTYWTNLDELLDIRSRIEMLITDQMRRDAEIEAIKAGGRPMTLRECMEAEEPGAGYTNQD